MDGRHLDRRAFLMAALAVAVLDPLRAETQPLARTPHVGIVADPPHEPNLRLEAFRRRLRELGYVEGRTIVLDVRRWDGTSGETPAIIAELIQMPVDVLVVSATGSTLAAKRRTRTVPIVSAGAGALLEAGVVASLARPGGNVTGLTSVQPALAAKRLDILREAIPALSSVAVLMSPYREIPAVGERYLRETEEAGRLLGLRLHVIRVETPAAIDTAFQGAVQHHADAGIILPNQFWGAHGKRVGELALRHRLPVMSQDPGIVETGGLLQYGVDIVDLWRLAAGYVDKILKGARPADLPVQQPTKFELIINLGTARALGLTIPASLLARADRVIE